ncbi:MAG: putative integral membrane [Bacteroidetes bacterium]|nr:MAG: putative integral membrane [Bacteroidota bacterium]
MPVTISAIIFAILTGIVIIFQGCLAAGVPWGAASMGGRYPGKYPPKMRVVAILNILILLFMAAIVLAEADLLLPQLKSISGFAVWVIAGFFVIGTVLNTITPSKIERIWAPVALVQLIMSVIVAIG